MKGKKKVFVFDDVDVMTNIERTLPNGIKKPVSFTVRKAHEKTLYEINQEIIEAKKKKKKIKATSGKKKKWVKTLTSNIHKFPKFIRKILLRWMFNHPTFKKKAMGTVNVTAVGMFGTGKGHMIHLTPHTVSLGVGGMDLLPFNYKGDIVNRQMLALTLALDHSVVDGAPAARFFHDLRQWLMYFCHDADWCFKSLPE
jgi:pyruvate/2-oxoglutarate dehydrogenase complex dihydrolipoamide acyltransferase (E2) component